MNNKYASEIEIELVLQLLNSARTRKKQLSLAALSVALPLASVAGPSESVQVFGDSAADPGNYFALPTNTLGTNAPYYKGPDHLTRLSDGPMWTELLFPDMATYSSQTSAGKPRKNYAFGDAVTGLGATNDESLPIGVRNQVTLHLEELAAGKVPKPTAHAAAFIEAGPNDYFAAIARNALTPDPAKPFGGLFDRENLKPVGNNVAKNLIQNAKDLSKVGYKRIYLTEMPDFGIAPLFSASRMELTPDEHAILKSQLATVTSDARAELLTQARALQSQLNDGTTLTVMPINELLSAVIQNPKAFGFTNVSDAYYDEDSDTLLEASSEKRQGYLFVDSLHTTAKGQRLQADYYREVLRSVEGTNQRELVRVVDGGTLTTGASNALILRHIDGAEMNQWKSFGGVEGVGDLADFRREDGSSFDRRLGGVYAAVGVARQVDGQYSWGGLLSTSSLSGSIKGNHFKWNDHQIGAAAFVTGKYDPVTATVIAGGEWSELDMTRDPKVPTFISRGSTDASTVYLELAVKRPLWKNERLSLDLDLRSGVSTSRVAGFSESGAKGLDMSWNAFDRYSALTDFGIRVTGSPTRAFGVPVIVNVAFLSEYEAGDRSYPVTAKLIGNTGAPLTTEADDGGRARIVADASILVPFARNWSFVFQDRMSVGRTGAADTRLSFGINARF